MFQSILFNKMLQTPIMLSMNKCLSTSNLSNLGSWWNL